MTAALRLHKVRRQPNVQRAQGRARRLYATSKGFQAAYVKGWRARRAKLSAGACPYDRVRGTGTWTFAWRAAWMQGWIEGEQ